MVTKIVTEGGLDGVVTAFMYSMCINGLAYWCIYMYMCTFIDDIDNELDVNV